MSCKGTENYIYYTDINTILGSGLNTTVYFGRHKRRAIPCAIKLFKENKFNIKEDEFEYMKKISHKNIVKFLDIEKDLKTNATAIIMEFCSENSLLNLLLDPKYYYGLPEHLYIDFINQFANGLYYLKIYQIDYQDIKLENILCIEQNGKIIFKLSNLNISYKLVFEEDECFTNETFNNEKLCYKFWSIGIILFQTACGQLPFQLYEDINNKQEIFDIISKKPSGIISGIQKEPNSDIAYSNSLPSTCILSQGILKYIIPLIVNLIEAYPEKQVKYDYYLNTSNIISNLIVIIVLDIMHSKYFYCYLSPCKKYKDFIEELSNQLSTDVNNMQIIYNNGYCLSDIIDIDNDTVNEFPLSSIKNPIILLPNLNQFISINLIESELNDLPLYPQSQSTELLAETKYAREANAFIYRVQLIIKRFIIIQDLTNTCYITVKNILDIKFDNMLQSYTQSIKLYNLMNDKSSLIEDLQLVINANIIIENNLKKSLEIIDSNCKKERCLSLMESHFNKSKSVYQQFQLDKDRSMNYNQDQLHRFEKINLIEKVKKVNDYIKNHCYYETNKTRKLFGEYFIERIKLLQNIEIHLLKLQNELKISNILPF